MSEKPETSSVRMPEDPVDREKLLKLLRGKVALATGFAIYEKTGSCSGKLAFIWATVVILGGFAKDIQNVEFNIVAVLLVIEGVRILCRSSEFKVPRRTFIYFLLVGLQISAALASFLLGYYRYYINLNHYIRLKKHSPSDLISTQYAAIFYFYGFCMFDGCVILVGKLSILMSLISDGYHKYNKDQPYRLSRVFTYALYVRYIKGSIFEDREIRILTLGVELLQSTDDDEQLTGALVLLQLAQNCQLVQSTEADKQRMCKFYQPFNEWMNISGPIAEKTLWAILTRRDVVERLIHMLNWRENDTDQQIRSAATAIVSIMDKKNPNLIALISPELRSALTQNLVERVVTVQ